jgi:hypothetical protein
MPSAIIENLDLEKPSFGPSKWPRKLKPAKNSKLPKLPENCFEPFGKGGWPPISTWIMIEEFFINFSLNGANITPRKAGVLYLHFMYHYSSLPCSVIWNSTNCVSSMVLYAFQMASQRNQCCFASSSPTLYNRGSFKDASFSGLVVIS